MNLLFESFYQNINFCLLIILTILTVPNINAQSNNVYTGIASIIDGDNLRIDGVNIRLLPTTGMTFPFLSYGGSSIIGSAIAAGLVLNLTKKKQSIQYNL